MDKSKKKHLKKSAFSLLAPYLAQNKALAFWAIMAILTASVVTLLFPIAVKGALDSNFSHFYFIYLFFLAFLLACASAIRYFCVISLSTKTIAKMQSDIFAHIVKLPMEFFNKTESGEIISRLSADATQVKEAMGTIFSIALRNLLMGLGALVMMFVSNFKLSLIVVCSVPFILVLLLFFGRKVRAKTRLAQDKLARANGLAVESIGAISTIQAFACEDILQRKFASFIKQAFQSSLAMIRARAFLTAFAIFIVFSSVIIVLYIGAFDVVKHRLSPGMLGQFILYAIFSASSFAQLSEVGSQFAQALGALERLAEIKNEKIAPAYKYEQKFMAPVQGEIKFENVSFAYPGRCSQAVLQDFNLHIKAGQKIAFVGHTGAGKSTIFSLLLNFYPLQEGAIFIDGENIENVNLRLLRKNIAYVSQDIDIFNGTIAENIAFSGPEADRGEIEKAAHSAYAYKFIRQMPQSFETIVGERGIMLSGGQKQRIALARAFLKNAPILLLDEATSALDAQSEQYVQEALARLMHNRTTMVIAHRLATIKQLDKIFVLEQGSIVEQGTHQELLAQNGVYANLARLQFNVGLD